MLKSNNGNLTFRITNRWRDAEDEIKDNAETHQERTKKHKSDNELATRRNALLESHLKDAKEKVASLEEKLERCQAEIDIEAEKKCSALKRKLLLSAFPKLLSFRTGRK